MPVEPLTPAEVLRRAKELIAQDRPSQAVSLLLETPAPFLAWLDSKPPTATVGLCDRPGECPFHTFAYETLGLNVRFYPTHFRLAESLTQHPNPLWVLRTINRIDDLAGWSTRHPVTAREVRECVAAAQLAEADDE